MQLGFADNHQELIEALIEDITVTQSRPDTNNDSDFNVVVVQVNDAFISFDRDKVTAHLEEFKKSLEESCNLYEKALQNLRLGELYSDDQLYQLYDTWTFGVEHKLVEHPHVEPLLAAVEPSGETLKLLKEARQKAEEAWGLYKRLSERILESWRKKYPRFSSMGTVNSDFQSTDLKAARS